MLGSGILPWILSLDQDRTTLSIPGTIENLTDERREGKTRWASMEEKTKLLQEDIIASAESRTIKAKGGAAAGGMLSQKAVSIPRAPPALSSFNFNFIITTAPDNTHFCP